MKADSPASRSEALPLPTAGRHRAGLPGDVDTITGSAFFPAPAYRQEGGASSRLARDYLGLLPHESLDRCCRIVSLCNIMVMEGLSSFKGGSTSFSPLEICPCFTAIELLKIGIYNRVIWFKTRGKGGE